MSESTAMTVSNPFRTDPSVATEQALTQVASHREQSEVQAMCVIAKQFPRDMVRVADAVLNDCTRVSLAEVSSYVYSRGGTEITGPSIRLAETLALRQGNFTFGLREVEQRHGESTVEAFAWDLENNTRRAMVFQVPHLRHTKSGSYKLEDPRDIYELVANQGARRVRACILSLIPGDLVEAALKQCEVTLNAKETVTADRIQKMVEGFAEFGVSKDMIEKRIQRRVDSITSGQMIQLRRIYSSIRDGMGSTADFFEVQPLPAGEQSTTKGVDRLKSKVKATTATAAPAPQPKPSPVATETKNGPEYAAVTALASAGISLAQAEAYYRATDDLKDNEPLLCLSETTMASITTDTAAVAGRIKAWMARSEAK